MRHFILTIFILILIVFMSASQNTIQIIYPNGGEKLYTNSTVQVKWESEDKSERVVIVLYENGIKKVTIAEGVVNSGIYPWKIPATFQTGKKFRLRIRLLNKLSVNDFSDQDFEIAVREQQ